MQIKLFSYKLRITFYWLAAAAFIFMNFNLYSQSGGPDLIITNVEFKYETLNRIHKPGDPVRGGDNSPPPVLYITIKNIGSRDLSDPFYIAYTNDEHNILIGTYSQLSLVNSKKNVIRSTESILFRIGGYINRNNNHFKFCILSDPKDFNNNMYPLVEEERYDNNTYECSILMNEK